MLDGVGSISAAGILGNTMQYRADLDGMRTVPLLLIVLGHLGVSGIPGAFICVDVFFVISGFLITSLLTEEQEKNGRVNFANFWLKRIRRLMPSLIIVVFLTLVASWFIFPKDLLSDFASSITPALFSFSNIHFWTTTGYFDQAAEFKPLLHTWSLGVEEQFYLFWPATIVVCLMLAKARAWVAPALIFGLGLASFVLGELVWGIGDFRLAGSYIHDPAKTEFYLTPFRVFEFAIGAVLRWAPPYTNVSKSVRTVCSFIGFAILLGCIFLLEESMRFPSYNALIPAVGTVMMIYFQRGTVMGQIVSLPPMVYIGKQTYSLYLVHWPVIVLFTVWKQAPTNALEKLMLFVLMCVISVLIFHFVEERLRRPKNKEKALSNGVFALCCLGTMLALSVAAAGILWKYPVQPNPLAALIYEEHAIERLPSDARSGRDAPDSSELPPFDYPLEKNDLNAAGGKLIANRYCTLAKIMNDHIDPEGTIICNLGAEKQAMTMGNSHEVHGYRLFRNLLDDEVQTGRLNVIFGGTHGSGRKGEDCDFHKKGGLPFRTPNRKCQWLADLMNDTQYIADHIDVIVVAALRQIDTASIYVDQAVAVQKLNPDVKVVIIGSLVDIKPYRCLDVANKSGDPQSCVDPALVDYYNPDEAEEIRQKWPELDFFYIDQRQLLCGDGPVEACDISYRNAPIFLDNNHFSTIAIPHFLEKAAGTGLRENLSDYVLGGEDEEPTGEGN